MSGWNLPPGVTQRMLDEAMGAGVCTCEREIDALVADGLDREEAEAQVEAEPCEACREADLADRYAAEREDADKARWEELRERD